MVEIRLDKDAIRRARAVQDWFSTFTMSSAYDASWDWPEIAYTVASDILTSAVVQQECISINNERARAWERANDWLNNSRSETVVAAGEVT